jgi:transposase
VWWLSLPTVSIEAFNLALAEFARDLGLGRDQRVILLCDQAGWHTSAQVIQPAGLHLLFLPPYSPELQPVERLWPLTNEPLANRTFESLEELETVQLEACLRLSADQERVRGHTLWQWWPDRESD